MKIEIVQGDCIEKLKAFPDCSIDCCITSPPYFGLRDYGISGQIGQETSVPEYLGKMFIVFREVRRVLKNSGTLWLNLGDSYAAATTVSGGPSIKQCSNAGSRYIGAPKRKLGLRSKNILGIPWRVAFHLQTCGWMLRQDIIWHKPNPMPESVTDRCTKAHEYIFLMSKTDSYYFDAAAISEDAKSHINGGTASKGVIGKQGWKGGTVNVSMRRNKRTIWTVVTRGYKGAHFATFPEKLVEPMILAGCPKGGTIIDPFSGAGTVGVVAERLMRNFIGIELNPDYCALAKERIADARRSRQAGRNS